jgi:hypothetical protein
MTHLPANNINIQENEPDSGKKRSGFTQDTEARLVSRGNALYDWREFVCGWGAAFINISVTFPIYKLIFRQVRNLSLSFCSFVLFITFYKESLSEVDSEPW